MPPNGERPTYLRIGCEGHERTLRIDTNSGKYLLAAPKGCASSERVNNFQVGEDHRLPRYLCTGCYKRCMDWKLFLDLVHESNETLHNDLVSSEAIVKEEPLFECLDLPSVGIISEEGIHEDHCFVNQEFSRFIVKEEPVLDFLETSLSKEVISNHNQNSKLEHELSKPIVKEEPLMMGTSVANSGGKYSQKLSKKTPKVIREAHGRSHTERISSEDKPFSCRLCDQKFTSKPALSYHKLNHTGRKRYQCSRCTMRFTHLSLVKTHEVTHTGVKPHLCRICKNRFMKTSDLVQHECALTGGKTKC